MPLVTRTYLWPRGHTHTYFGDYKKSGAGWGVPGLKICNCDCSYYSSRVDFKEFPGFTRLEIKGKRYNVYQV